MAKKSPEEKWRAVPDFTALGDSVNTAARLAASAATGQILVSTAAAEAAAIETGGLEARTLELRGRAESVDAWVLTATPTVELASV